MSGFAVFPALIKTWIVGTLEDAQLKAALGYFEKVPKSTTGRR